MKLFTVGPVEMYPESLELGGKQDPYFRTQAFSDMMLGIERKFLKSVNAPQGSRFAALTMSGTGAMEAAVSSVFTQEDKVLVIDGGSFGHRFAQICEIHRIPYQTIHLNFLQEFTADMLAPFENQGFTGLLVNYCETSTGQSYDLNILGNFCHRNGMYLIVDAVSAYLADSLDMQQQNVDLILTASQKALALAPGLSLVAASPRVTEERILKNRPNTLYLNLAGYFENQKRGQPPFTSAVSIVRMLAQRLDVIEQSGMRAVVAQHHKRAVYFRTKARQLGIMMPCYRLSNCCTPLIFPKGNAKQIYQYLSEKYGLVVTPSGGAQAEKELRVGHLGNLQLSDYDILIDRMKEIL